MPNRIEFICPACKGIILAPASLEGAAATCPKCGARENCWRLANKSRPNTPHRPVAKSFLVRRKWFLVASAAVLLSVVGSFGVEFRSLSGDAPSAVTGDLLVQVQEQSLPTGAVAPVSQSTPANQASAPVANPANALPVAEPAIPPANKFDVTPFSQPTVPLPNPTVPLTKPTVTPVTPPTVPPANKPNVTPAPPPTVPPVKPSSETPAKKPTLPPLNEKVRDFVTKKMGQQVGDGDCWILAYEALNATHAKRPGRDGLSTYQFGTPVKLGAALPGDVLQFEETNFKHTDPDGRWYSNSFPHHTAIVSSVSGTEITLAHQNYNGDRTVKPITIDLKDRLPGGTIKAYRPALR